MPEKKAVWGAEILSSCDIIKYSRRALLQQGVYDFEIKTLKYCRNISA